MFLRRIIGATAGRANAIRLLQAGEMQGCGTGGAPGRLRFQHDIVAANPARDACQLHPGRRGLRAKIGNGVDTILLLRTVHIEFHFFAHFLVEERLGQRREITHDMLLGIRIPCAKN